ncbi:MAG: GatB/YqeY domain-containing protein [Desulfobulbaceae bacterium]|nr:GatB/YqeY domain-containing protein [Desulfobulbaceae bacterium]
MTLQEKIQADLKEAMLAKDQARISALRIILGEFARQPNKELTDQEVHFGGAADGNMVRRILDSL